MDMYFSYNNLIILLSCNAVAVLVLAVVACNLLVSKQQLKTLGVFLAKDYLRNISDKLNEYKLDELMGLICNNTPSATLTKVEGVDKEETLLRIGLGKDIVDITVRQDEDKRLKLRRIDVNGEEVGNPYLKPKDSDKFIKQAGLLAGILEGI